MTRNELKADDIKPGAEIAWTETAFVVEDHYAGTVVELFEQEWDVAPSEVEGDMLGEKTTKTRVRLEDEDGEEFSVLLTTFTDVSDGVTIDEFTPADEGEDEDEPELVTDGGEDVSEVFTDDEIQTAIDSNAAETTTEEVRDVLTMVQRSVEEVWDIHMDNVEDNAMELVSIDGDTLVFADHTGQFWNSEFDNGPLGEAYLGHGVHNVVTQLHHEWAERHTDYSWSVDDPVVVRKPAGFDAGQRLVESVVVGLIERGLTPRQAWSVWGVLAGNSRNNWATRMGYDSHSGVSNAVREAKEKIPLNYL